MATIKLFRKKIKFKQVFLVVMHWYNGFLIYLTYLLLSALAIINNPPFIVSVQIFIRGNAFITCICLQS